MEETKIQFKNSEEKDENIPLEKREVEIITTKQIEVADKETTTIFELDLKIAGAEGRVKDIDVEKEGLLAQIEKLKAKKEQILEAVK